MLNLCLTHQKLLLGTMYHFRQLSNINSLECYNTLITQAQSFCMINAICDTTMHISYSQRDFNMIIADSDGHNECLLEGDIESALICEI